jgi:FixJ family two-component response regulator
MQAVYRETDVTFPPRSYRNRPSPISTKFVREQPCDVVHLVEADQAISADLSAYLEAQGLKVLAFASASDYLGFVGGHTAACVILNIQLPDLSGLELQRQLAERANTPVLFIGDRCDIASTVRAMKAGAVDFFTRPFDLPALVAAVRAALAQDWRQRQRKAELAQLQARFSLLTPREREVLPLVVGGLLNKQAASILEISEVTLQIHRSQVMRKMQAESFADLVRMAVKLRIPHWRGVPLDREPRQEMPTFGGLRRLGSLMPNGIR